MTIELADHTSPSAPLAAFVSRHRLFFHDKRWLGCYETSAIRQAVLLNRNREVIGCFIYYVFKKGPFRFIITPPYTPDLCLFFVNPGESEVGKNSFVKQVMEAVADHFEGLGVHYMSLNLPAEVRDVQPLIWRKFLARSRYTYLLDLRLSSEELWKNLSPEKRKSVNKAQKDGIDVKPDTNPDTIFGLIAASLGRNAKNKHEPVIRKILATCLGSPDCLAYVAYEGDRPLAATFCVIDRNRAVYLFGGYAGEGSHHGAGVSCMWQSILEARSRGCVIFDFEGSMNRTIERYFREFGPSLVNYQCVEKMTPLLGLLLKIKGHRPL